MGHHDDGSPFLIDFFKKIDDLLACVRVKVSRRLVRQYNRRVIGKYTRQGHPLLLTYA